MAYDNDIFISYAHRDNRPLTAEGAGWISELHHALEVRVGQLLGRDPKVWRDPKLDGNDFFAETLVDELPRAATLVCVLTESYLNSEWCRKELLEFWQAAHGRGAPESKKARVFKVVKSLLPLERQPEELQKLLGYEFYKVDPESERPLELDLSMYPELKRDYWARVNDLAHDLAGLLQALGGGNGGGGERGSVFLAETSTDLREERDRIRRDLIGHGYRVLPDRPLPTSVEELGPFLREQLGDCLLSIHLVGRRYGLVPEGSDESAVALQHALAAERSGAGGLMRLIWLPQGLEAKDPRQVEFVERLRANDSTYVRGDLLEVPIEDLKTVIHQQLQAAREARRKKAGEPPAAGSSGPLRVYLICRHEDLGHTAALEEHLFERGLEVIVPSFEEDEAAVRRYHEENLGLCDAFLLYFGAAGEPWLRGQLRELVESRGQETGRRPPATAVLLAPPLDPRKERFRTHEAQVLTMPGEFDPEVLEPFLREIEDARSEGQG